MQRNSNRAAVPLHLSYEMLPLAALISALLIGNLGDLGHRWRRGGSMGEDPAAGQPSEKTGSTTDEARSGL